MFKVRVRSTVPGSTCYQITAGRVLVTVHPALSAEQPFYLLFIIVSHHLYVFGNLDIHGDAAGCPAYLLKKSSKSKVLSDSSLDPRSNPIVFQHMRYVCISGGEFGVVGQLYLQH